MGSSISIVYNSSKGIYTVTGQLPNLATNISTNRLIQERNIPLLFINLTNFGFSFHSFFAYEIKCILEELLTAKPTANILNINNIKGVIDYIDNTICNKEYPTIDISIIDNLFVHKVLPMQEVVFSTYSRLLHDFNYRGMLLDMATGTGKTFTSLSLAEAIGADKIIITADLSIINNVWVHAIRDELYKNKQSYYVVNDDIPYKGQKFILVNYEKMDRLHNYTDHVTDKTVLIVDESHNFADIKSNRTQELISIVDNSKLHNVFLLSGTPIKAYVSEVPIILKLLDTRFTADIEKTFTSIYSTPTLFMGEILRNRLSHYSARVSKDALELDPIIGPIYIPIKVSNGEQYTLTHVSKLMAEYIARRKIEIDTNMEKYIDSYLSLYSKAKAIAVKAGIPTSVFIRYEKDVEDIRVAYNTKKLYTVQSKIANSNDVEKNYLLPYLTKADRDMFKEVKSIYKYPILKIQEEALGRVLTKIRIECYKDLALTADFRTIIDNSEKKTIIFSNYIEVCSVTETILRKEKYKPIGVYGDNATDLDRSVRTFKENDKVNPLITTYKSLSTGVPLTVANTVVAIDMPYRMYTYIQAMARVWRLGQSSQVYSYILQLDTGDEPNINSRDINIIKYFKSEVERITGYTAEIAIDSDITLSTEERILEMYKEQPVIEQTKNILHTW